MSLRDVMLPAVLFYYLHLKGMNFKVLPESKLWQENRRETLGVWMSVSDGQMRRVRFIIFIHLSWNSSHGNISLPNSTHMISSSAWYPAVLRSLVVVEKKANSHNVLVCWSCHNKIPHTGWLIYFLVVLWSGSPRSRYHHALYLGRSFLLSYR